MISLSFMFIITVVITKKEVNLIKSHSCIKILFFNFEISQKGITKVKTDNGDKVLKMYIFW